MNKCLLFADTCLDRLLASVTPNDSKCVQRTNEWVHFTLISKDFSEAFVIFASNI